MSFYVGSTNIYPGILPAPSAAASGAPLVAGSTTSGFWAYPGSSQTTPSGSLQTRSIFTHGYVAGGYKDSNPWRTINKTWHSNDVTISCGEQLQAAASYIGGTFSDYYGYVHAASNAHAAANAHTSSYNLATGVNRTVTTTPSGANPGGPFGYTGKDPNGDGQGIAYGTGGSVVGVGSWELSVARSYFAGTQNQIGQIGYITGGPESSACDKFYFPTEIMYTTTSPGVNGSHCTAAGGTDYAWWSIAGNQRRLTFSNDSWATWTPGTSAAPDGVCKFLNTKLGYHYGGTGGNVTSGFQKWSDSTGSTITSSLSKPQALGEENFEMGQNWGYCLGQYNGQQNNYTFKVNYSTDAMTVLGTASQPKGHAGLSSGVCSSAAASVTMNTF